ncbi:hypothetical protein HY405_01660 [Candidatus Microgenomates bacterium]|nr:hypothetical protein [Candidatus Microgenomates bacterium]
MDRKPLYVLGLNEALCASAALLRNGEIIAAASEERFTGIKNHWGFPKHATKFVCDFAGITTRELDLVVLSYIDPYPHFTFNRAQERSEIAPEFLQKLRNTAPGLEYKFPVLTPLSALLRRVYYLVYQPRNQLLQVQEIARFLHIDQEKIMRMDHHLAHAYTAYFSNPGRSEKPTLILTCDGAGDNLCTSVFLVRNGSFKRIASTPHIHSLGLLYATVTSYLGLKAHEDEYKVMGLAPYAHKRDYSKIYDIFKNLIWVENLQFNSIIPSRHFGLYLEEELKRFRFDHIAGALQAFTEDILVEWVRNAVQKTKIHNVAVSGGVFQNVKANQKIARLPQVREIFFMPSPADETNAIGAAYYGYKFEIRNSKFEIKPLTNLYLGPEYSQAEILKSLKGYPNLQVKKPKNLAKSVARLLARGEIVARLSGRMEFGTRALGNRSILADPRNQSVVEKINKMIKMRDFWMPFAPTILADCAHLYIKNPKNLDAPFMILTFDTTPQGQHELRAAIHPYDKTTRPQLLKKEDNPAYYYLIDEFRKITGVAALLNTSFNLHGEPIVCTPQQALRVFTKSGLSYLVLKDLIIQKSSQNQPNN